VEEELHAFLTSGLYGSESSASRPRHFTVREGAPGTQCTGSGPVAGLDVVAKNIFTTPAGNRTPIVQPHRLLTILVLHYCGDRGGRSKYFGLQACAQSSEQEVHFSTNGCRNIRKMNRIVHFFLRKKV
jgi:hypothetical protein